MIKAGHTIFVFESMNAHEENCINKWLTNLTQREFANTATSIVSEISVNEFTIVSTTGTAVLPPVLLFSP